MRGGRGTTACCGTFSQPMGIRPLSLTASLLVALSDGLLEIAYLDGPEGVPSLVREALARLLVRH